MSGLKLLPLIASVGLVMASYVSLVNGDSRQTPASLSELGDLEAMDWVQYIRKLYSIKLGKPDYAFELLKKLDKISESLGGDGGDGDDDDGSTQIDERDRQKLAELIEANRWKNDEFCTRNNLKELDLLLLDHNTFVLRHEMHYGFDGSYHQSVERYIDRRRDMLRRLCRSYVLEDLNKRVASLNDADKNDMSLLGEQLARAEQKESLIKFDGNAQKKCSAIWMDILLKFFEEKYDKITNPKCNITGKRGRECFKGLWHDRVVRMCSRWEDATSEVMSFEYCQSRHLGDCTEQQTSWIDYGRACRSIRLYEYLLADSLYNEFKRKSSNIDKLKSKLSSGFKKLSCSGGNQLID